MQRARNLLIRTGAIVIGFGTINAANTAMADTSLSKARSNLQLTAPIKNGISPNGISPNGISPNGISPNGISPNGVDRNGLTTKSMEAARVTIPQLEIVGITLPQL